MDQEECCATLEARVEHLGISAAADASNESDGKWGAQTAEESQETDLSAGNQGDRHDKGGGNQENVFQSRCAAPKAHGQGSLAA
jgi:hypothetical protein